ncbi:hypothetical protein [Streptomyces sp. NPDC020965]|uniref:hypothetical protein n=1 Tax=Streptomyces sp. NPDC020965 TaxID=3365105 RepID=UPI0037BB4A2F
MVAVLAVAAEVEREGIREKTLEGLDTATRKGNVGGRPSVMDDDKLTVARARYAKGESVTAIAKALSIGPGVSAFSVPERRAQAPSDTRGISRKCPGRLHRTLSTDVSGLGVQRVRQTPVGRQPEGGRGLGFMVPWR